MQNKDCITRRKTLIKKRVVYEIEGEPTLPGIVTFALLNSGVLRLQANTKLRRAGDNGDTFMALTALRLEDVLYALHQMVARDLAVGAIEHLPLTAPECKPKFAVKKITHAVRKPAVKRRKVVRVIADKEPLVEAMEEPIAAPRIAPKAQRSRIDPGYQLPELRNMDAGSRLDGREEVRQRQDEYANRKGKRRGE